MRLHSGVSTMLSILHGGEWSVVPQMVYKLDHADSLNQVQLPLLTCMGVADGKT